MTVFGPHYPELLQPAVSHAERLAVVVARLEASADVSPSSRPWLVGRAAEIEHVVGLAIDDWREQRASEQQAADAIGRYLADLHHDIRAEFGLSAVLDCCFPDAESTVAIDHDDVTRHVLPPAVDISDTIADPQAILRWLKPAGR